MMDRITREQEIYNQGLDRSSFNKLFAHCQHHFLNKISYLISEEFEHSQENNILELGSNSWGDWIEKYQIIPKRITCINISIRELKRGLEKASSTENHPHFLLMDAHKLAFADESFDMIFGGGILHHLDLSNTLEEIHRSLKQKGKIIFLEPLDINPISIIARYLTPNARTPDETPFRIRHFSAISEYFNCDITGLQFSVVPLGVISKYFFSNPENHIMIIADILDLLLQKVFPPIKYLYRYALIVGEKK